MKYMVGLNFSNDRLTDCVLENDEKIYEVYFSFSNFANGRSNQLLNDNLTPWEMQSKQLEVLKKLNDSGIAFNMLFNANCYGKDSQSRAFFNNVGMAMDYIKSNFNLNSITTTSPLIAKFSKNNFSDIEVRASVNMEIGTVEGMEYVAPYFDSYYVRRELNRNIDALLELKNWADANGKELYGLGNSGCLNYCSAHVFHDNLVAHEDEISKMDNAYNFTGMCKEFLSNPENYKKLIDYTNFIRPEDIDKYNGIFKAIKLATRVHRNPVTVVESYVRGKYSGNILDILEPQHSIYPYALQNGEPLKLVNMEEAYFLERG